MLCYCGYGRSILKLAFILNEKFEFISVILSKDVLKCSNSLLLHVFEIYFKNIDLKILANSMRLIQIVIIVVSLLKLNY